MKKIDSTKLPLFSRKLRLLRSEQHLTQELLANNVGMTREMITYLESRAQNPTAEVIKKFADYFNVSADVFIYEDQEKINHPGPISKLERQLDKIKKLPKSKQKIISNMLDGAIKSE